MTTSMLIETDRLVLRTVTIDDIEEVALSWKLDDGPIPHEEARKQVKWMLDNHEKNAQGTFVHLCLAIIHKDNGQFIGWCGLDHRDKANIDPVLFYLLKEPYWGKGLATEAAQAVLRNGFCELGLSKIDGGASSENIASKRVMEKIGMRYMGRDEEGGFSFTLTGEEYSQGS